MTPAAPHIRPARLVEVDSLRGVAAVLVMLFHLTSRYEELYRHNSAPLASLPWGHYGVNLFFMISGFVIFMTLERTRTALDFAVSRVSRLFPAYWTAVAATFVITHWVALPGKTVGIRDAALNLLMFHGLFHIPHVDEVYWTLEVELLFYCYMLALFQYHWLSRIHTVLIAWLAFRWIYFVVDTTLGISLPFLLYRVAILAYIPFFAIGICVFLAVKHPGRYGHRNAIVIALALVTLAVAESFALSTVAALSAAALWLAATGRVTMLRNVVIAWLGTISYTLYLLHENIGWGVIMVLERQGFGANAAIAVALFTVISAASLLTVVVERPAMYAIRSWYKHRFSRNARPATM